MKVIGLTGGVGAGKSSVLEWMREEWNAYVIVTDLVGRRLMEPGGATYRSLLETFGETILAGDGTIRRERLAELVFRDEASVQRVNAIVHPLVKEAVAQELEQVRQAQTHAYAVVESALLREGGLTEFCDAVWYLYASSAVRIKRLMESRGYTRQRCQAVMDRQLSDEQFRREADAVIDNSGDFEDTKQQIRNLLKRQ